MQNKYFDLVYKNYEETVLLEEMVLTNPTNNSSYNLPKIKKTTVYISNISSNFDDKIFRMIFGLMSIIFNQYPKVCFSKNSNSNLKIREKDLVGIKINLNKKNTYILCENLFISFPRRLYSKPKITSVKNNIIIEVSDIIKIYNSEFQYDLFSRLSSINLFFKVSKFSQHFISIFSIPSIISKEKEEDLF